MKQASIYEISTSKYKQETGKRKGIIQKIVYLITLPVAALLKILIFLLSLIFAILTWPYQFGKNVLTQLYVFKNNIAASIRNIFSLKCTTQIKIPQLKTISLRKTQKPFQKCSIAFCNVGNSQKKTIATQPDSEQKILKRSASTQLLRQFNSNKKLQNCEEQKNRCELLGERNQNFYQQKLILKSQIKELKQQADAQVSMLKKLLREKSQQVRSIRKQSIQIIEKIIGLQKDSMIKQQKLSNYERIIKQLTKKYNDTQQNWKKVSEQNIELKLSLQKKQMEVRQSQQAVNNQRRHIRKISLLLGEQDMAEQEGSEEEISTSFYKQMIYSKIGVSNWSVESEIFEFKSSQMTETGEINVDS